jgi:hypothetical protein
LQEISRLRFCHKKDLSHYALRWKGQKGIGGFTNKQGTQLCDLLPMLT